MSRRRPKKSTEIQGKPKRRRRSQRAPSTLDAGAPQGRSLNDSDFRSARWTGALLFLVALAIRLLFWHATPDAAWPHSAHFKGDAPTWVEYAQSLESGTDFELGLPLRPPGAGYLLAALWDGHSGLARAQFAWCLLGALTVLLVFDASRRTFGYASALLAGLFCALSHGLMVLSTSLNNETPYLFLVTCTLWMASRLGAGPAPAGRVSGTWMWAWGLVHGLACLVRVEHLLFFVLTTAWLVASPPTHPKKAKQHFGPWRSVVHILAAFALVLLPWHLKAWSAIERFNTEPPDETSATAMAQAQLESMLGEVQWTPTAAAERDALPAFARRASANFVAATKLYRWGPDAPTQLILEPADLDALDQAFGSRPEPLPARPFVTFYGGLNFYLAHNPWAEAGFSRTALDQPPPLDDSAGGFPPILIDGLPPPTLAFTYPPHLHAINHGYGLGLGNILSERASTAKRLAARARIFWGGAALGFGGSGLPATGDLLRRRADLAVPHGGVFRVWQAIWLSLVAVGLWWGLRCRNESGFAFWHLLPWLALALTKLTVSLAFFGYARHGAGAYPAFALLAALGLVGLLRRCGLDLDTAPARRKLVAGAAAVGIAFLALEAWRVVDPPQIQIDGRAIEAGDPWPVDLHEDRILVKS